MQKFPKIISYLEYFRPDVFDLFNSLGMQGDLNPKQKGSITFLCPDAELTKQIKQVIEGETPEDATDMLASLILTELYTSPSSMVDGGVKTHLGRLLPVKRIGSKDVTLANGAVISPTIDPPFVPFARKGAVKRDNMAIWQYSGPMWDYANAEHADNAKPKKVAPPPSGSVSGSKVGARKRLVKVVQAAAAQYYAENSYEYVQHDGVKNPFIRASACILSNIRGDMQTVSQVIPFICTPSRVITFYALVGLVDEEVLSNCNNWQNARSPYDMNLINSCIEEWMEFTAQETPKPLLSTREGQTQFYNTVARFIKDTPKSNLIHKKEMQAIDTLISSNKFANLTNVLSKGSHDAVHASPNMFKLVNFASYQIIAQLDEITGSGNRQSVQELLTEIDRYYLGTREAIAARVEGLESYDKMSNEFNNDDWQFMKRNRFCQSLLWSLPMQREVGAYFTEKLADESSVVLSKAQASNIVGSNDIGISNSTRNELREYLRLKGQTPDSIKDLL